MSRPQCVKWFYGGSTLYTSPRLHFKLNAIHGHATLQHHSSSPSHAKNRNTPLPDRPIHWLGKVSCENRTSIYDVAMWIYWLKFLINNWKLHFVLYVIWTSWLHTCYSSLWVGQSLTVALPVLSGLSPYRSRIRQTKHLHFHVWRKTWYWRWNKLLWKYLNSIL